MTEFLHLLTMLMSTSQYTIYPISLHDALPIFTNSDDQARKPIKWHNSIVPKKLDFKEERIQIACSFISKLVESEYAVMRSEEHTSELQSRGHLVCRLLLEKKKE